VSSWLNNNFFSPQRHKVIHEGTSKSKVQAVRASRNGMRWKGVFSPHPQSLSMRRGRQWHFWCWGSGHFSFDYWAFIIEYLFKQNANRKLIIFQLCDFV